MHFAKKIPQFQTTFQLLKVEAFNKRIVRMIQLGLSLDTTDDKDLEQTVETQITETVSEAIEAESTMDYAM